jgi:general secretion pathway protein J
MTRARGFTLLEVMVALVVMGLFSLMAYRALDAVLGAEARARAEIERWRVLERAFGRVQGDLANVLDMPLAGRGFRLAEYAGGQELSWDRLLPDDEPGGLRRAGYRQAGGRLSRLVWREAAPPGEAAAEAPLLDGLDALHFRCLDGQGAWHDAWPLAGMEARPPRAVEIQLTLAGGAVVRRVMLAQ